jgi:Txe/YoeB family toxin of Txe-Axe toxin-antitoxin module
MKIINKGSQIWSAQAEDVIIQLLAIEADDLNSQHQAITTITALTSELKSSFAQRSIIWDQIIRCFAKQSKKPSPMTLLLSELKHGEGIISTSSHLQKALDKQYCRSGEWSIQTLLSNRMIDLEKYHAQLRRDNKILLKEQRLLKKLYQDQKKILSIVEKLQLGLSAVNVTKRRFIENGLIYTIQVERDELYLQSQITEQGILSLELILNKNQALLYKVSQLLILSLEI